MSISHLSPQPHPQTAGRVIDDEAVLILTDVGEVTVLNSVGARIFELSDGHHTVAQITECIIDEFDVSATVAEQDVTSFVESMVAQKRVGFFGETAQ